MLGANTVWRTPVVRQLLRPRGVAAGFASEVEKRGGPEVVKQEGSQAPAIQKDAQEFIPTITEKGIAFPGDLRSTSGLGLGDKIFNHTDKWLQGKSKSPMQYCKEAAPIKVHGAVVASYGADDPSLGCPVEYIDLRGTSQESPAVCKYTGNKYWSDTWRHSH